MVVNNVRIQQQALLPTPAALLQDLPASSSIAKRVHFTRQAVADILTGKDSRLLLIVGPCSIHDPKAGLEYAQKLHALAASVQDQALIIMRTYFEKPRTRLGWTGLINDPDLDGTGRIHKGLRVARQLLLDINQLGLPTAVEWLDTMTPQYLADLVSWAAIGARTSESQGHRHLVSGLSMPVGFKNGTSGDIQCATDAVKVAAKPHRFMGINEHGQAIVAETLGNPHCHIVLRGGYGSGPNYAPDYVAAAADKMAELPVRRSVMIDCSHGNCHKDHRRQAEVLHSVAEQLQQQGSPICGIMLESFLQAGSQDIHSKPRQYGVSVTDPCLSFAETESLILDLLNRRQVWPVTDSVMS